MKDNEKLNSDNTYEVSRKGFLCLLHNVHTIDNEDYRMNRMRQNITGKEVSKLLQKHFIGQYYSHRMKFPVYLHNATKINAYFKYINKNVKNTFKDIYLYLLGYLSFIEISDPLILIGNCTKYLDEDNKINSFNFSIYDKSYSAREKLTDIKSRLDRILTTKNDWDNKLQDFINLSSVMDRIYDRELRNAIAHCDYSVKRDGKILIKTKGNLTPYSFDDIKRIYDSTFYYLKGYMSAIDEFSKDIIPGIDITFSWGPKY